MCLGSVHVFCGVKDPTCDDLQLNLTCNACIIGPVPEQLQAATTAMQATADARKDPPKEKMKDAMEAPPNKKSSEAKTHHQAAEPVPTKLKKSATALSFRLAATTGKQDPLIMKSVCFLAEDGACGGKLAEPFGGVGKIEKTMSPVGGKLCLFGNAVPKKGNANVVACDVQWEDLVLGEIKIDLQVIVPAMESSVKMKRRQTLSAGKSGRPKKHSAVGPCCSKMVA
jgi:hypothetical protein